MEEDHIEESTYDNLLPKLVMTREFDAPREFLWKAWTDPGMLGVWWGPTVHTSPYNEIDLRVGGRFLICMRVPDGKDLWGTGTYLEIVEPELLVIMDSFADEQGNKVPASYYDMHDTYPLEMKFSVEFKDLDGKTRMTLTYDDIGGIPEGDLHEMEQGWNQSFDKLEMMAVNRFTVDRTDLTITVERTFFAPRDSLFKAYTDANLVSQWWGPARFETIVDVLDPNSGGAWRFVNRDTDGTEYGFHGEFREVNPEQIVYTFEFEGMPGHISDETVTLFDNDGTTTIRDQIEFASIEDLDGMVQTGMMEGLAESMDRLAMLMDEMTGRTDTRQSFTRFACP
jgi:uncharacterized protein YndB with AHSA1/START domain